VVFDLEFFCVYDMVGVVYVCGYVFEGSDVGGVYWGGFWFWFCGEVGFCDGECIDGY